MPIIIGLLILILLVLVFGPIILLVCGVAAATVLAMVLWVLVKLFWVAVWGFAAFVVIGLIGMAIGADKSGPEREEEKRQKYEEAQNRANRDAATMDALLRKHAEGKYKPAPRESYMLPKDDAE